MTLARPARTEYAPLFDWSPKRDRRVSLFGFTVASAALHALCFYVFQIIYPPTVALLPPPARVNLITPQSEEGRVLLRWVEAEDPALSSTTQRPAGAVISALPRPEHVPSYLNRQPALRELPPLQPDLSVPSSRPPAPVSMPRAAPPAVVAPATTTVTFSGNTEALGDPQIPPFKFVSTSPDLPEAAQFRVGLSAGGAVLYCFLDRSSGDRQLDQQARAYLMQCRFPSIGHRDPAPAPSTIWTLATFQWGSDLSRQPAASAEAPAP